MIHKKTLLAGICFSEIFMMILSTFAFAFMIASTLAVTAVAATPIVDAASPLDFTVKGCCTQANDGSVCQDMSAGAAELLCKNPLVLTDCNHVSNCQKGCCYSKEDGVCSMNSPKEKCTDNGGEWSSNAMCNIPECYMGCCVINDQASVTSSRECTKLSRDYKVTKQLMPLDENGGCSAYSGLTNKGACLIPTDDYSGENTCQSTTKAACNGIFYENYLCTAPELNTDCMKSTNTTCYTDDRIYYQDTCGNMANVYDSTKYNSVDYWTYVEDPRYSCSNPSASCGNCQYVGGTRCTAYDKLKDAKPTYGDNVCRSLNCDNGRKHGESWCISDYNTAQFGASPVGSRFYRGICMDGEISIETCADFNNEVCMEVASGSYTEAKCQTNQWRSCLAANNKQTYEEIKSECDKYEQCTLFEDIIFEGLKTEAGESETSNGTAPWSSMPGFLRVNNNKQGASDDGVGKEANPVVAHCVPKYTPGMVFWQSESATKNPTTAATPTNAVASANSEYGGSVAETNAICSLGGFVCINHLKKENPLNPSSSWSNADLNNWVCNIDSNNAKSETSIPIWMAGLNEKCKMLGPCGISPNIAGEIGNYVEGSSNSSIKRSMVDEKSKTKDNLDVSKYNIDKTYIENLVERPQIKTIGSITDKADSALAGDIKLTTAGSSSETIPSAGSTETSVTAAETAAQAAINSQNKMDAEKLLGTLFGTAGLFGIQSVGGAGTIWTGSETVNAAGQTITKGGPTIGKPGWAGQASAAALGASAGALLGGLIADKWLHYSPGKTKAFTNAMMGVGAAAGVAIYSYLPAMMSDKVVATWGTPGGFGWTVIVIAIIYAIYSYYFTGVDNEYYITEYSCKAWEPPAKGECDACNTDVRPCSEYSCRSIGKNCQYYTDLGEPGYCAQMTDTGSATISPWQQVITEGHKYTDVGEMRFSIATSSDRELDAWKGVEFGIVTDKPANCKIDTTHRDTYDEMATSFTIDNSDANNVENTHHKIAISPFVTAGGIAQSTLSMKPGENNYYIRCKNFAGSWNTAEFAVKVNVGQGPDLTPPIITSFTPESGSYVKFGENITTISLNVNEPSECRYTQENNLRFEDMTGKMSCFSVPSAGTLGNWPCTATTGNLTKGENKFYFQCKDHPEYEAEEKSTQRNINRVSKEYTANLCMEGLKIIDVKPDSKIITGISPISIDLEATTAGCINNGEATCAYSINNKGYVEFYTTNGKTHTQTFSTMIPGNYNISVQCSDKAGNTAERSVLLKIDLDNTVPIITRTYDLNKNLYVMTNENTVCAYNNNISTACSFKFTDNVTIMSGEYSLLHTTPWKVNQPYFIKCKDIYGNTNDDCAIKLNTY